MASGKVILLHGATSSGKTTVARAFQRRADDAWVRLGIDVFWSAIDARWMEFGARASEGFQWVERADGVAIVGGPVGQRLAAAMRASVSATARIGLNVIVDDVLVEDSWRRTRGHSNVCAETEPKRLQNLPNGRPGTRSVRSAS